jgi:hypothetical protein
MIPFRGWGAPFHAHDKSSKKTGKGLDAVLVQSIVEAFIPFFDVGRTLIWPGGIPMSPPREAGRHSSRALIIFSLDAHCRRAHRVRSGDKILPHSRVRKRSGRCHRAL